jgi:fatty acid synthase subunit beta
MSAKTALELGAPIRGILAFTSTSTYALVSSVILPLLNSIYSDKAGRSVPAPGKGALTVAREVPSTHPLPILDIAYRSRQIAFRRKQISEWLSHEYSQLHEEQEFRRAQGESIDQGYFSSRIADIEKEAVRQEKDTLAMYGMLEGTDPRVAPLRRALAVWGLTADDIGVLSIHGTSTNANVSHVTFTPVTLSDTTPTHRRKTRPTSGTIS